MKLQVFEFIDETIEQLKGKKEELWWIANHLEKFFEEVLQEEDSYLNISSRVKSEDSLKEKILRQNFFLRYKRPDVVLERMVDLLGVRIECRFIRDEARIYERLVELFRTRLDDGFYRSELNDSIQLRIRESQPQKQHNGFEIYKLDGRYRTETTLYHFELQIKSFVNIFWGDIDHRILYKNFTYLATEDFIREVMYSIKDNLEMVDSQLMVVYNHLYNTEKNGTQSTKDQLKKLISKQIHDIFLLRFKATTGIVLDFRKPTDLIVDYIFAKAHYAREIEDSEYIIKLLNRLMEISRKELVFGDYIDLNGDRNWTGEYCALFGGGVESIMNLDLKWNLILSIIFELEGGDKSAEFVNFIEYIVFTIIYRVRTAVKQTKLTVDNGDQVTNGFTAEIFEYICYEYNADFFTLNNMRTIERLVLEFTEDMEPEELLSESDYKRFRKRLIKEVEG
ncbi:MAG: GTP pyrophosphokinase [Tissierellia bacterium]|nr:GTP pyrophosphokinase [Tissierellia bacterium]